ncbi:hypothetical protein BWQ96_01627 [Gracilariopsis chorda]|uniref:Uncharacterized protein n=1 Tax=Gracilariopsis chorda TaxID=448386 RepID=A0A2V3J243_9FLOR|nr:hypothetical protein BWQ96_01627 [Gracilariopsis chorda]|eukprot:PXF48458.1 hypothetical protein BWQ96_01627 [Gracilariopsis chorda]
MAFVSSFSGAKPQSNRNSLPRLSSFRQMTATASLSRRSFLTTLTAIPILIPSLPQPALADRTAVGARRSFDRYHPRILSLIDTLKEIRTFVTRSDASGAAALITDKQFDIKGRRALSIYATGFSDNYVGQRSKDMLRCVDGFYKEMGLVADGTNMEEHYGKAVTLLNTYYEQARLPQKELSGLALD